MITIIDYGTSNFGSMQNILKKIGAASKIAVSPGDLLKEYRRPRGGFLRCRDEEIVLLRNGPIVDR
jgi:hypothetical protein